MVTINDNNDVVIMVEIGPRYTACLRNLSCAVRNRLANREINRRFVSRSGERLNKLSTGQFLMLRIFAEVIIN
jgi:hypothetical protein